MTRAEEYLFKAAELSALAEDEANPTLSSGFRQLAECCLQLAEQLDQDSETNVGDFCISKRLSIGLS
jgi:hypothetical protein